MLKNPQKSLIDIQNIFDNEFPELCLKGQLHSADDDPARIRKVNKMLQSQLDSKDIKFSLKVWNIYITEKRTVSVFLIIKTKKNIQFIYQKIL